MKKKRIPGIGLRIIKSAIGVFLCYIINYLRGGSGIVFYSQLAVLWCMQDNIPDTKAKAKQRTIGTIIGAIYGLVCLVMLKRFCPNSDISPFPTTPMDISKNYYLKASIVSIFIIIILYTTVVLKKKQASYFSCVVFLSIVVNHAADVNPYLFVWNRFLDTMIGIVLGVVVNTFHLPHHYNKKLLFISGLDDTLLSEKDNLTDYSRVELNRMINSGALFTISTMRTPASLMDPLQKINLKLPLIVMDGAALYDINNKSYIFEYVISNDTSAKLINIFSECGIPYFANVIIDDLLVIYYQESTRGTYNRIIEELRRSPYRNYVRRDLPESERVVYFMLIDSTEIIQSLYQALLENPDFTNLKILCYESDKYPGNSYLKIYNHNATKHNMLDYLKEILNVSETYSFGTIEGKYDYIIQHGDSNQVIKIMKKKYEGR